MKATTIADAERAAKEGRLGIYYQFQNATPLQRDLDRVDLRRRAHRTDECGRDAHRHLARIDGHHGRCHQVIETTHVIEDDPEEIRILQEEEGAQFQPDQWPLYINELNGPRRMEVVLDGLSKRGYKGDALEKIAGKNLYRLYTDVIG